MFLKLISSPWFWADIALSLSGGLLVFWGLWIEKKAEVAMPPADFDADIFEDIIEQQKFKLAHGWRILMFGIVVEVVAALGISVISGLEIAGLKEKTATANLEAKQAGKDAAEAKLLVANTESNNLILKSQVLVLSTRAEDRTISSEKRRNFIEQLKNVPKGSIRMGTRHPDRETLSFSVQIHTLLVEAGYKIESSMNYPANVLPVNGNSDIAFIFDTYGNAPAFGSDLDEAFKKIGINPTTFENVTNRFYSPDEGVGVSNKLLLMVVEKP